MSFPNTVWHASRYDLQRPTLQGRIAGDNHDNSGLGIYCATAPERYIAGFGEWIYALHLRDNLSTLRLGIQELSKMGWNEDRSPRDRAWFEDQGRKWAQSHDLVELVECDGQVAQVVILRDEAIVQVQKYTQEQYLALALPEPTGPRVKMSP